MKLNCAVAGTGQPMVLLHGVTRRWQSFLPVMAGLGTGCSLTVVDLPGHGGSGRLRRYRVADYIAPLVELLEDRFAEPVIVYGHSLGSMLAAALAAEVPKLVRAVVMEDPPFETMGSRIREGILHDWFQALLPFAGSDLPLPELARQLGEARAGGARLKELRDAVALRFTAASLKRMDPLVLEPIVAGEWLLGYDRDSVLKAVRCPALLVQADPAAGAMLTDGDAAQASGLMGDCISVRVPGAPHLIHWADPGAMVRLVQGFISSLE